MKVVLSYDLPFKKTSQNKTLCFTFNIVFEIVGSIKYNKAFFMLGVKFSIELPSILYFSKLTTHAYCHIPESAIVRRSSYSLKLCLFGILLSQ